MNGNKMGVIPNSIAATFLLSSSAAQSQSSSSAIAGDAIVVKKDLPASILVEVLRDPDGQAQVRNVASSSRPCFALFENNVVGTNAAGHEGLIPDSGVILSTGDPLDFAGNDSDRTTTDFEEETGEPYLESQLPRGDRVFDHCFIEFEFKCPLATESYAPAVSLEYVFGSDEYDGGANGSAQPDNNDAFGVFLNGENIALLPDGRLPVTVNSVNGQANAEYYIDNQLRGRTNSQSRYAGIEADGFTTRLRASAAPPSGWNSLKLVIGDVHDGRLDSWALLAADSFTCAGDAVASAKSKSGTRRFRLSKEVAILTIVMLGVIALVIPLSCWAVTNHQRVQDDKKRRAKEEKEKKDKEKKDKEKKKKEKEEKEEKEKEEKAKKEKKKKEEANRRSPLIYIYGPYVYMSNQFGQWMA